MSKILKISKHKLDLARVELTGPSLLIGRSPTCDQVLRAPGILPVHFLLEWVGEGKFDPDEGMWTLFDMGHLVSEAGDNVKNATEGIVIDKEQQYLGLNWSIVQDRFKASHIQRGIISDQLKESVHNKNVTEIQKLALEVVCLSQKDQKVKEVWHFFDQKLDSSHQNQIIPFVLEWSSEDQVLIKFDSLPTSVFNIKGERINIGKELTLFPQKTLIIHFLEEIYFVRFINQVEYIPSKEHFFQNKFWIQSFISLIVFCVFLLGLKITQKPFVEDKSKSIVRVVQIVVPEVAESKIVEPVIIEPKKEEAPKEPKASKIPDVAAVTQKELPAIKESKIVNIKKPEEAIVPAAVSSNENNLGKISDVNAVGLLGKIKNKKAQGQNLQISADAITKTFVNNTASGSDNKGVLIPTSQMNIIDYKKSSATTTSSPKENGANLMEAQTTLKGAKDFNVANSGQLAHTQGLNGTHNIVSDSKLSQNNTNDSGGSTTASGSAEVSGGLTKAQVFAVINSNRREIRTCFESALLVRNDLNGILRMSFSINIEGFVTEIKVVNSEIDSSILESCVIQVIRKMNFPQTPNQLSSTVIYPFVFKRVK